MRAHKCVRNSMARAVLALGLTLSLSAMATHRSRAVANFDAEHSRNIEELMCEWRPPKAVIPVGRFSRIWMSSGKSRINLSFICNVRTKETAHGDTG